MRTVQDPHQICQEHGAGPNHPPSELAEPLGTHCYEVGIELDGTFLAHEIAEGLILLHYLPVSVRLIT